MTINNNTILNICICIACAIAGAIILNVARPPEVKTVYYQSPTTDVEGLWTKLSKYDDDIAPTPAYDYSIKYKTSNGHTHGHTHDYVEPAYVGELVTELRNMRNLPAEGLPYKGYHD